MRAGDMFRAKYMCIPYQTFNALSELLEGWGESVGLAFADRMLDFHSAQTSSHEYT